MQRCKRDFPYVATLNRRLVNDRVKGTDFHWSHLARYRFVEDRHSLTSSNGGRQERIISWKDYVPGCSTLSLYGLRMGFKSIKLIDRVGVGYLCIGSCY